jgi:carbonic anhydrase/acetyltransferase-like protein (isoleucine patch superfamily)
MASIYSFDGFVPVVHESAFVHPNATVVGNVIIGRDVYVGPGAVVRGDWGGVEIADGCNVQEGRTSGTVRWCTARTSGATHSSA